MVSWLFWWHDNHRRTALLPFAVFLVFVAFQLASVIRFREPLVPEPVGYLIAAALLLATLVSLSLSLAHWVRTQTVTDVITHIDRLGMDLTGVRMAIERSIREAVANWNGPTSTGNPRVFIPPPQGTYGRGRTLSAVDDDPTEAFDQMVVRNFDKRDIDLEPPTGDVAS